MVLPLEQSNTEKSCLPTVGRWGCEWPSWLENASLWVPEGPLLVGATKVAGDAGKKNNAILPRNNNSHLGENCIILYKNDRHLLEVTQVEGPWPIDHPLPLPAWAPQDKAPLKFTTVWEYEELVSNVEYYVQKILKEHNYNTVGNFLSLYQGFKRSGCSSLSEFYQRYVQPQKYSKKTGFIWTFLLYFIKHSIFIANEIRNSHGISIRTKLTIEAISMSLK